MALTPWHPPWTKDRTSPISDDQLPTPVPPADGLAPLPTVSGLKLPDVVEALNRLVTSHNELLRKLAR